MFNISKSIIDFNNILFIFKGITIDRLINLLTKSKRFNTKIDKQTLRVGKYYKNMIYLHYILS